MNLELNRDELRKLRNEVEVTVTRDLTDTDSRRLEKIIRLLQVIAICSIHLVARGVSE